MNQSHHLEHDIFVNTPIETLRDRLYAARCVASEPFERGGGSGSAEHEGDRDTAALSASPDAAFCHVDREPADYQDDWELPALPDEEAPAYGKFDRTRAYDTRTLRILAILEEHTDEEHALSAPQAVLSASQFAPSAPQAAAPPPQAIAPAPEAPTVHDSNR